MDARKGPVDGQRDEVDELEQLASDLLAMTVDERLETLRRYVELRASVEPVGR